MGLLYFLESLILLVYIGVIWASHSSSSPLLGALGVKYLISEAQLSLGMWQTSSQYCGALVWIHETGEPENQPQVPRKGG